MPFFGLKYRIAAFYLVVLTFFSHFVSGQSMGVSQQPLRNASGEYYYPSTRKATTGIPAGALRTIQKQNELLKSQGRNVTVHSYSRASSSTSSSVCGTCHDMGVENGWSVWQAQEGYARFLVGDTFLSPIVPAAQRFNITTGAGIDRLTPGVNAGDPPITVVAPPGFGNSSIQLGQLETDGQGGGCLPPQQPGQQQQGQGCAERLTYCFTVGILDTNFIYAYAFVMENPTDSVSSHLPDDMPYVEFLMLDANGDTIQCAYQQYIANQAFGGQYKCNASRASTSGAFRDTAIYKPWTIEGVNLTNYIGQNLTVVITNADCTLGGHFAHSYWDFACGSNASVIKPNCYPNAPDTLVGPAPPDSSISYSYLWFKNNDPVSIGNTQVITPYSQNGDTFTVKVSSAAGCDWYARFIPQHFNITTDFNYSTHCGYADFSDTSFSPSTEDPISYWSWNFTSGNPAVSATASQSNVRFPPGSYAVQLISGTYSPGCRDTITKTIRVPQYPVADFATNDLCAGTPLALLNNSTVSVGDTLQTYRWDFSGGNPDTSSVRTPSVVYASAGTYQVSLFVSTTNGCSDSTRHSVIVHEVPVADFLVDSVCLGDTITLINQSLFLDPNDTLSYAWTIPGGLPSSTNVEDTVVVYNTPLSSQIQLITTSQFGCADTIRRTAVVHPLPVASYSAPRVCYGTPIAISNSSAVSMGDTVQSYAWKFPNGVPTTSSDSSPVVTFSLLDTSFTTLVVTTVNGCTDTANVAIVATADPSATFIANSLCVFDTLHVLNTSSTNPPGEPMYFSWDVSGSNSMTTTDENPTVYYTIPDSSLITLIATAVGGCADTIQKKIAIYPLPAPAINVSNICFGDTAHVLNATTLSPGDTISSYRWSFQEATPPTSTVISPSVYFNAPGAFDISLVATTKHGCVDSTLSQIVVYRPPVAAISPGDSGCVPVCRTFTDLSIPNDGTIDQWNWSFPGGVPVRSTDQNPGEICYDEPGVYPVSLDIVSSTGCKSSLLVDSMIRGYSLPNADFSISTQGVTYSNPVFWFDDNSSDNVVKWEWDFGDGSPIDATGPNPYHSYASSMTGNDFYNYVTTLLVTTKYGCVDTISRPLDVTPNFTFYIPSSFTPNGDLKNNTFYGKGLGITEYEIWIFDRWGLELYYCKEKGSNVPYDTWGEEGMPAACQWDGKLFGKTVQQDVYVWKVRLKDIFGKVHSYLGRVTVYY